jgi:hypothetical protein
MWNLCEPGKLKSEGGYYLTVFEAAIGYLSELPPNGDSWVINPLDGILV